MHNVSAFGRDSFALQYCYVMKEKTYHQQVTSSLGSHEKVVTRKQRFPANPYGFSVGPANLSARQAAIVVALGLSKS